VQFFFLLRSTRFNTNQELQLAEMKVENKKTANAKKPGKLIADTPYQENHIGRIFFFQKISNSPQLSDDN